MLSRKNPVVSKHLRETAFKVEIPLFGDCSQRVAIGKRVYQGVPLYLSNTTALFFPGSFQSSTVQTAANPLHILGGFYV